MLRAIVPRTRLQKIAVLILVIVALWIVLHLLFHSTLASDPVVIAHRGAAGLAPENTLAAVRAGLAENATLIEIDIRRTADGVLILMHDDTVDRTTNGSGAIHELTAGAIAALDAGAHFAAEFAGEPVPTLRDVLDLLRDEPVTLVIEVKDPDRYPGIADDLAALLDEYNAHTRVVVITFDHAWLERFRRISPQTPTGTLHIITGAVAPVPDTQFIDVHWTNVLLDPTLIWRAHRADRRVMVWTVDNSTLMRVLLGLGADGITTNRPDVWNDVRES